MKNNKLTLTGSAVAAGGASVYYGSQGVGFNAASSVSFSFSGVVSWGSLFLVVGMGSLVYTGYTYRQTIGENLVYTGKVVLNKTQTLSTAIVNNGKKIGAAVLHRSQELGAAVVDNVQRVGAAVLHRSQELGGAVVGNVQRVGAAVLDTFRELGEAVGLTNVANSQVGLEEQILISVKEPRDNESNIPSDPKQLFSKDVDQLINYQDSRKIQEFSNKQLIRNI